MLWFDEAYDGKCIRVGFGWIIFGFDFDMKAYCVVVFVEDKCFVFFVVVYDIEGVDVRESFRNDACDRQLAVLRECGQGCGFRGCDGVVFSLGRSVVLALSEVDECA